MIPIKLHLKNFLSYGSKLQTIDFGAYPLICLSGRNGHGKSALLDAITWALWGQARKLSGVSKPDAHLLRLGQTNMLVIFDFKFNGTIYRVRREFTQQNNKAHAVLEFGLLDVQADKIKPLTDKTIKSTQDVIESVIGLDYEAFTNSAFLRQGQSNEFSKKSPKERKEILASILRLDHYEELRKIASEKVRTLQGNVQHILTKQEHVLEKLKEKDELIKAHALVKQERTILDQQEALAHEKRIALEQHLHKKDALIQQKDMLNKQEQTALDQQKSLQDEIQKLFTQWRIVLRTQQKKPDIARIEKEKQDISSRIKEYQDRLERYLAHKEQYVQLKQEEQRIVIRLNEEFGQHQHIYLAQVESVEHEKKLLITQSQETQNRYTAIKQELQTLIQELTTLNQKKSSHIVEQITAFEKDFEKKKQYYHVWVNRLTQTTQEIKNLEQKIEMAQATNPSCPLCEQNLSIARKKFLANKFMQSQGFYQRRHIRLTKVLKILKATLVEHHTQKEQFAKTLDEQTRIGHILETLLKQKSALEITQTELESTLLQQQALLANTEKQLIVCQKQLKEFQAKKEQFISEQKEYRVMQERLGTLEKELNLFSYKQEDHKELLKKRDELDTQQTHYYQLVQESSAQQERKSAIHRLCKQLKQIRSHLKEYAREIEALNNTLNSFARHQESLKIVYSTLEELVRKRELLILQEGNIEQALKQCAALEKEFETIKEEKALLEKRIYEYQMAAQAFSKDGIQALLIEDAIPEIEQESNALLAQLTDNQAHIFIDSLRDLKKGGTKETLDIKISDPMGVRPYELFSGGEAFRIDFALRIAISKLLARRAGTSLQTLIIDEGFGSQDEEGLHRLMDAMYKIQDNFAKVIIVSHLNAMKDQFPVHFVVEKGAHGSMVKVIEQG